MVKFAIDDAISMMESDSLPYRHPNLDGLESESWVIQFRSPNRLSLSSALLFLRSDPDPQFFDGPSPASLVYFIMVKGVGTLFQ